MSTTVGQISRLATLSHVLYDREVLELRQENARLKMELFWKDYGVRDLSVSMFNGNDHSIGAPKCRCFSCCLTRRRNEMVSLPFQRECSFKPWIEQRILNLGMTIVDADPMKSIVHVCNPGATAYDQDAHFVRVSKCDFVDLTYGAKIFAAKDPADPELQKLVRLFNSMRAFACDDDM
jgi:hypothetical protein